MSDRRPLADHGAILSQIRKWGRTKITNRINEEKIKKHPCIGGNIAFFGIEMSDIG